MSINSDKTDKKLFCHYRNDLCHHRNVFYRYGNDRFGSDIFFTFITKAFE